MLGLALALLILAEGSAPPPLTSAPATRTRCHGTWGHGIQCDTEAAKTEDQKRADKLRKDTGALVAAGKCDDAQAMALKAGDFGLAKEIKDYCAAPAAESRPSQGQRSQ